VQQLLLTRLGGVEPLLRGRHDLVAKTCAEQSIAPASQIGIGRNRGADGDRRAAIGRDHQLEIADALRRRARCDLREHLARLRRRRTELGEGLEEMIVAVARRIPMTHRHRVDRL
jgi:hypothetical protein